jgi:hypothetical protein
MKRKFLLFVLSLAVASWLLPAAPAAAVDKIWTGYVVHVSTNNIKVVNTSATQTLSFLILPKFNKLFSSDGKTTYQMTSLQRNMLVKVYYDQGLLGQRHADQIYILNAEGMALHRS